MTLSAERMVAQREGGEIVAVVAEGSPVEFTQTTPSAVTANAATITYRVEAQIIELTGDVELLQGENQVRGERIEYDLLKGELIAGSVDPGEGEQIEFVLDDLD